MSDLLVGLVEALAGAVQAARERREGPPAAPEPAVVPMPPMGQVKAATAAQPPSRPPRIQPPARPAIPEEPPQAVSDLAEALGDPGWLVRGFIIGEVLGRPIALRRQNPWDVDGVQ